MKTQIAHMKLAIKSNRTAYVLASAAYDCAVRSSTLPRRAGIIRRHVERHDKLRILIGAGGHQRPGWLSSDIRPIGNNSIYLDVTKIWPFENDSVDALYCEHMIEHIPYIKALFMIREARRVLRPTGWLRIATPDLDRILALKREDLTEVERNYIVWSNRHWGELDNGSDDNVCSVLNRMFRNWGHQFIYDQATLAGLLEKGGFKHPQFRKLGESDYEDFCGLENHHSLQIGEAYNRLETMVIETQK